MSRPRLLLVLALPLLLAVPCGAEEDSPPIPDSVRRATIKRLGRTLRRRARSPRAEEHREEIVGLLDSLRVLGGPEAGEAALGALAFEDEEVRDLAMALVEEEHHPDLVGPLADLLEDRDFRRDADVRKRVARALSIMADPSAVLPLTSLIRTDEDPHVVAAAADGLATYASAPLELRKEAVRRLIDAYTATYNLMMSVRPEDAVISRVMRKRYEVYGRSLRHALQALTGQQLTRPQEWRRWWNENKKRRDW